MRESWMQKWKLFSGCSMGIQNGLENSKSLPLLKSFPDSSEPIAWVPKTCSPLGIFNPCLALSHPHRSGGYKRYIYWMSGPATQPAGFVVRGNWVQILLLSYELSDLGQVFTLLTFHFLINKMRRPSCLTFGFVVRIIWKGKVLGYSWYSMTHISVCIFCPSPTKHDSWFSS